MIIGKTLVVFACFFAVQSAYAGSCSIWTAADLSQADVLNKEPKTIIKPTLKSCAAAAVAEAQESAAQKPAPKPEGRGEFGIEAGFVTGSGVGSGAMVGMFAWSESADKKSGGDVRFSIGKVGGKWIGYLEDPFYSKHLYVGMNLNATPHRLEFNFDGGVPVVQGHIFATAHYAKIENRGDLKWQSRDLGQGEGHEIGPMIVLRKTYSKLVFLNITAGSFISFNHKAGSNWVTDTEGNVINKPYYEVRDTGAVLHEVRFKQEGFSHRERVTATANFRFNKNKPYGIRVLAEADRMSLKGREVKGLNYTIDPTIRHTSNKGAFVLVSGYVNLGK
jgi:hypothetical protein